MSFHIQFKTIQDDADILMSETRDTCPDSFVDSLTGYPNDAVPPDGEAEPEGCGLDQSTDDHTYNQAPLSYELQQGLRILKELMSDSNKSVNWHFLNPVDDSHPETADYYEKIKKPLWLGRMKEKFDNREYETITQFVADFRQMLENCYRFNGPDHFVSRRAQKLETMMEQKLNLLSRDLREKTSIAATSGQQQDDSLPVIPGMRRRSKAIVPHDSTVLLNQLRVEELQKEREARKQQMLERKAVLDAHIQGMMEWEDHLMEGQREHVKAMWEFPSIGLFLFLCHYPLNIGEVSQFELERCLFMPRESTTLQRVMTSLLSTPFQRQRLEKTGMMPYRVWNEKLRDRMEPWFKLLRDSHDPYKSADKFGIDPFLFKVVGKRNPMKKRKFHELSLYKKVWILKSLCDNCIESQESLVKTIDSQYPEEQKEYRLGEDAEGNTYLHFPQFCGADVRIYRQAFIPEPEMDGQQMEDVEEEEQPKSTSKRKPEKKERNRDRSKSKEKTTVPKKKPKTVKTSEIPAVPTSRPSRLRQTIKTVLPTSVIDESSTDDEFETTEEDASQSESESRCDSEEPENDSGMDNNTPFKNILRNRITDRENLSETSSIDSDILWGMHRTRSGRIRFNGAMRMDNDIALANENSCDFDSTMSETSNPCPSGSKKTQQVNNASFCSVKTDKTFSENEMNSDSCQKDIDERGDCSSTFTENSISDMESRNKGGLDDKNHRPTDNLHNNNSSSHQSDLQVNPELQGSTEFIDEDSSTSNDFSEIDSQFSNLDENMSKSSSQHKSDIVTISRIFNKNMREKIYGNDSDTNSSFNEDILKTSHIILKQNGSSHVYENSVKQQTVINSKDDNLTSAEFFQVKSPDLDRTDILVKRGEVTPSNEIGSDTDTEFDDEKIEIDCLGTSHVKTEKSDYVSSKPVVEDQKKELNVSGNSEILDIKIEPKNEKEIKTEVSENNKDSTSHLNMIKIEPDEKTAECLEKSFTDNFKKENEMDMLKDTECVTTEEMSVVKEEVMEESDEEEEETDLVEGPEVGPFELVAESVEDIRNLVEKFSEPEPYTVGRGKKTRVVKPPPRKRCVVQLHNRLVYLLKELEPWEQKLIQATKKARLKLKKEYECYDEKEDNGWESDHSESTNSATEDNSMDIESSPMKTRLLNIPKDSSIMAQNDDSRTSEDFGEWDISLRGRIRKRRIIPNNVEDQGLSKKRKIETTQPVTTDISNTLPYCKTVQSPSNMVSLVSSSTSQVQNPSHLLLTTSGGTTYYAGLNQEHIRMLSQTKQTAHPIIQQLLRQPGMTSPRPLVNTTTSQNTPSGSKPIKKQVVTPQKLPVSSVKGTQSPGKVQYFAANINSLPPAVIQQLIKSNALTIQPGNNQQGMILLTAVNPTESGSSPGTKATLTIQNPVTVQQNVPANIKSMSDSFNNVQSGQNETKVLTDISKIYASQDSKPLSVSVVPNLSSEQSSVGTSLGQSHQPLTNSVISFSPSTGSTILTTSTAHHPVLSCKQTGQTVTDNKLKQGAQNVPMSLPHTTQQKLIINSAPNQSIRLQNVGQNIGMNLINSGGYILNSGQNQNVALQLTPSVNIGGQSALNIGGQGLTLQQIQALALQGINLQGISLQGSNLVVQPNAGLRIQNPINIQGQIFGSTAQVQNVGNLTNINSLSMPSQGVILPQTVNPNQDTALKGLLNTASCSTTGLCPSISPISPVINSAVQASLTTSICSDLVSSGIEIPNSPVCGIPISPGRSQCKYASNVTVKTLLEARKPSFTETSPETHGTIVVQSTATGVKKLKLPSKAALDSAIQTVVREVKTSLPTANIKVPSPVTMPSIHPRRNITKTIQSMKVPIPTTPKVEAMSTGQLTVQLSPTNSLQPTSPVIGQPNLAIASPLQSGLLNFNQLNSGGQIMLANVKSNANIGQNVVQGYLTPQGLIIPSANLKNLQNIQKIGNSNVIGNVSAGSDQNSLQTGVQSVSNMLTNSAILGGNNISDKVDSIPTNQISRDIKHLQNLQDLRSVAGINLVSQMGSQQFVPKPIVTSVAANPVPIGNFVYLSPSANLQQGSQIIVNTNQTVAPLKLNTQLMKTDSVTVTSSTAQAISSVSLNTAGSSSTQNVLPKTFMSLPLSAAKTEPAKKIVMSLPLATAKTDSAINTLSSVKSDHNANSTKIQPAVVNTIASNATLLSHLNSPVLKTNVNHLSTGTSKIPVENLVISGVNKVTGQNRLTINTNIKPLNTQQLTSQRPVMASPVRTPVLLGQQGSSSEIIKKLAAAQVLGTNVQHGQSPQTLTFTGGNKLLVHMPGQTNLSNLQSDGKLPAQVNKGNTGKIVIPVSRTNQMTLASTAITNVNALLPGQQKSAPTTSTSNKVMIQVPGQTPTMLLISPQKPLLLGSQKSTLTNVSPSQSQQSLQQIILPNNVGTPKLDKDQSSLQLSTPKTVISTIKSQSMENIFKFSTTLANSYVAQPSATQGVIQQKVIKTAPLVLPGNTASIVSVNSLSSGTMTTTVAKSCSLQTTVSPSQAKTNGAPGTPQKLFLYNINGQLVTAQGVPVTVDNGVLKILPQPKVQMANFSLPKSPPASSGQHANVPISPKPGQAITNTQQAYLNVLTSNGNMTSGQTLVQPTSTQQLIKTPLTHSTAEPKTVVRNLNATLNEAPTSIGNVKQTSPVSTSVTKTVDTELNRMKPSFGFVVMPETGGQTQIVFPQPNIHSNQPAKASINNIQGSNLLSTTLPSVGQIGGSLPPGAVTINSPLMKKTFLQNLKVLPGQTVKLNNVTQKVSNTVPLSNSSHHDGGNSGQNEQTVNSAEDNTANSTVDAEEAALNLLSLANQRFSS